MCQFQSATEHSLLQVPQNEICSCDSKHAFVGPVLRQGGGSGASVEVRVRIVPLPFDVRAQVPVDARRKLGRSLRGHARIGETELELSAIRGDVADSGRQLPSAPPSVARVERMSWLNPPVGRIFARQQVGSLREIAGVREGIGAVDPLCERGRSAVGGESVQRMLVLRVFGHQSERAYVVVGLRLQTRAQARRGHARVVGEPGAHAVCLVGRDRAAAFIAIRTGDTEAQPLQPPVLAQFERCREDSADEILAVVVVDVSSGVGRGVVRHPVHQRGVIEDPAVQKSAVQVETSVAVRDQVLDLRALAEFQVAIRL